LIAPEKRIAKPTTAIAAAATHAFREHSVPRTMFTAPAPASPRKARNLLRIGPAKSANTSTAKDPNAAKTAV
jgi:hypothetical protein